MKRDESEVERRLRDLEITAAARDKLIEIMRSDILQIARDHKSFDTRIQAIEKSLIRLSIPLKAATWAAAVFATSVIALIWSLVIGKAQVVFP